MINYFGLNSVNGIFVVIFEKYVFEGSNKLFADSCIDDFTYARDDQSPENHFLRFFDNHLISEALLAELGGLALILNEPGLMNNLSCNYGTLNSDLLWNDIV